ncbi:MAG: 4Fe-4S dicluster domain-containing protein [Anaerolineae bacterium]|nr:4Fe-4S dicluster domain-containing protein [Anaerolineae bacterium]
MTNLNISVRFLNHLFLNPVIPAAGPNVGSGEKVRRAAEGGAGGLLTKTISRTAAPVPHPNMVRFGKDNLLNAELWSEHSPEVWFEREYDIALTTAREHQLPLIASVGYTPQDLAALGPRLEQKGVDIIEFSIHYLDAKRLTETAQTLRNAVSIPIIAKLSPSTGDLGEIARLLDPYVDGFACINSFGPTLMIDIEHGSAMLGSKYGYGGLSGPSLKPLAVGSVFEVALVTNKPIIGVGGVTRGEDVIEFLMAGASLVGVCTAAILKGPDVYGKIAAETAQWLEAHGYQDIDEIKGIYLKKYRQGQPVVTAIEKTAWVNEIQCKTCTQCEKVCQFDALHAPPKQVAHVDVGSCTACGLCVSVCPFGALELRPRLDVSKIH